MSLSHPDQADRIKPRRGNTIFSQLYLDAIDFFLLESQVVCWGMLLVQEFATVQSGIGYTLLDWKRADPTLAFHWCCDTMKQDANGPGFIRAGLAGNGTTLCFRTNLGVTCHLLMACKITRSLTHWALMGPLRSSGERAPWCQQHPWSWMCLCKVNGSGSHCRSLENWFAVWDIVVWQS